MGHRDTEESSVEKKQTTIKENNSLVRTPTNIHQWALDILHCPLFLPHTHIPLLIPTLPLTPILLPSFPLPLTPIPSPHAHTPPLIPTLPLTPILLPSCPHSSPRSHSSPHTHTPPPCPHSSPHSHSPHTHTPPLMPTLHT